MEESHLCRVCGFDAQEPLWEDNNPNWLICSCCGAESGYHDNSYESVQTARKKWAEGGYQWSHPKDKPVNWDLQKQLTTIPDKWK